MKWHDVGKELPQLNCVEKMMYICVLRQKISYYAA